MNTTDFYALLTGSTPEIEVAPNLWLERDGTRFVLSDDYRRLLLSPQEATFTGIALLINHWPVPSCTG